MANEMRRQQEMFESNDDRIVVEPNPFARFVCY